MKLGINIDHIATLRQARGEEEPSLIEAAKETLAAGADGITIHLREDRRHIQDQDVIDIRKIAPRLNLEMAATPEIIEIACKIKPEFCCIVPEKRKELTTEGGLDVIGNKENLAKAIKTLNKANIEVSIFIDPDLPQISATAEIGAQYIEIHTGCYANAKNQESVDIELKKIIKATEHAVNIGLKVNAGHGLKYHNTKPIVKIPNIEELNIGHSIISRAVFIGLKNAVKEMLELIKKSS
jgi:pyridoxine 5-phosphate synthase